MADQCNDDKEPTKTVGTDDEEEDWSEFMTNDLSAGNFARHDDVKVIHLSNGRTIKIAATASLSPLDMIDLSWGTSDATGHRVWMGALLWCQALPALTTIFENAGVAGICRCMELGTGTGLGGIATVAYFGRHNSMEFELVLTDNSLSALNLCRLNCDLNELSARNESNLKSLEIEKLEWGSSLPAGSASRNCVDVVIATDVIYDIAAWLPLLKTVQEQLKVGGIFLLSHVPRADLPAEVLLSEHVSSHGQPQCLATIECYLLDTALEFDLECKRLIRPQDLKPFPQQQHMVDAGAAILVFQLQAET